MSTQTATLTHKNANTISKVYSKTKTTYESLCDKEATLALVGLGYVGLPIALEFAKTFKVIGFDINNSRVQLMKQHIDPSKELVMADFKNKDIEFTADPINLRKADVMVVAVPTPVSKDKTPDLTPLSKACKTVGEGLSKGNIVVFESTVYPGCTEEVCIPILEKISGLKCNEDFWVGYSPERINPGDKKHTLTKITKIVSGSDSYAEDEIYNIYDHIIEAGVHLAPSMKVAEAAKIVENTQRDVNIALMNELSTFFDALDINTHDVLSAAGTKWNFLNFYPGLVGGHCIGVDPYYLIHKASSIGMDLDVISSSRKTNDGMPAKVVELLKANLADQGKNLSDAKVLVLGATFKENVSDLRNSKAAEMSQLLNAQAKTLDIIEPYADGVELFNYYGLEKAQVMDSDYDAVVYAVNHDKFESIDWDFIKSITNTESVVFDFKKSLGFLNDNNGVKYLTL